MNKNIFVGIIIFLVGGASFYAGTRYSESKRVGAREGRNMLGQINAVGQRGGVVRGGNGNAGEVILKDDKSMTLKLRDGGSRIIFFSKNTEVIKNTDAVLNDVGVGTQVLVTGSANQDGSVNAQSIQILLVPIK